jgi:hypothetical protein
MFARMNEIRLGHGALAKPDVDGEAGDLESHLAYLGRRKAVGNRRD